MIKKIIFDLDGTLWETKKSYIYAYQKVQDKYNLPKITNEYLLSLMGLDLVSLSKVIFGGNAEIASDALMYSAEYIHQNPQTYSQDIYKLFSELSLECEIYLISNCPKLYIDTFLSISNVKDFVKAYYHDNLQKNQAIELITNNYQDKAIFIGDAEDDYNAIANHTQVIFINANYGYNKNHCFNFCIDSLDACKQIVKTIIKNDYILQGLNYTIENVNTSNLIVYQKDGLSYFGFANFLDNNDAEKLINKIAQKYTGIIGPINRNSWHDYRISLDNFDFQLYPDCLNNENVLNAFYNNGFKLKNIYAGTLAKINQKFYNRSKKSVLKQGYSYKIYSSIDSLDCLKEIYEISVDVFSANSYFENISFEDFKNSYLENLKNLQFDLTTIFHNGKLVAYHFCYEDPLKRFYVSKTIAIKKEYQSQGLIMNLIFYSYQKMIDKGYSEVLYHFQNYSSKLLNIIYKGCLIKQKKYGVLQHEKTVQ